MNASCPDCGVEMPGVRYPYPCDQCAGVRTRRQRVCFAALDREWPNMPMDVVAKLARQFLFPDDVRAMSDRELLEIPMFGPTRLRRLRAAIDEADTVVACNWVAEATPA